MLSIEADPAWVKAKLLEVKHLALPSDGFLLLPGEDDREIEGEVIEAEEREPEGPEYNFDEGDEPPIKGTKMSLETAINVKNRDGVKYGDLETEKLSHMHNALQKWLSNNPDASIEEVEKKQYKMDAIREILADRE